MICEAYTIHSTGHKDPCSMQSKENSINCCYYHTEMFHGNITPFFEDAVVKTKSGVTLYAPGNKTKVRRKK